MFQLRIYQILFAILLYLQRKSGKPVGYWRRMNETEVKNICNHWKNFTRVVNDKNQWTYLLSTLSAGIKSPKNKTSHHYFYLYQNILMDKTVYPQIDKLIDFAPNNLNILRKIVKSLPKMTLRLRQTFFWWNWHNSDLENGPKTAVPCFVDTLKIPITLTSIMPNAGVSCKVKLSKDFITSSTCLLPL